MKNIVLGLLLLLPVASFASKARMAALQGADHAVDVQTVFTNPSHIGALKPLLAFEMGAPGTDAEGGILKNLASGEKMLVYLGHQNSSLVPYTTTLTDIRTSTGFLGQNNPVEVIIGNSDKAYGFSISNVNNELAGTKETTLVGKYGATLSDRSYYAHLHLVSTAEKPSGTKSDKMSAGPRVVLGGSLEQAYRYSGSLIIGRGESAPAAGGTVSVNDFALNVGIEDRSLKTAASDIYYGAKLIIANRDVDGKKITENSVPVFFGLEHAMTTWATFRGSVSQNLLLGSTKDETASTKADGIPSNTTVTAGLGLAYNNLQLDGSLTAAGDGAINGNQFITQAGVTYNF